ncbi:unnamed protein product [Nesidiocoris tenuis]|uniref:Uncharacterized protein n=1 Tax=Nesidiocoris tenuis TaxID=355587 RepID=A0A6H5HDB5_9HEMI|nr:unnamed protein product [Nesidiocoris tenuis]
MLDTNHQYPKVLSPPHPRPQTKRPVSFVRRGRSAASDQAFFLPHAASINNTQYRVPLHAPAHLSNDCLYLTDTWSLHFCLTV